MNISEFSFNITNEILDHFSSRKGLKRLDRSTVTQQTAEGTFVCDSPLIDNLKFFFQASGETDTSQASAATQSKDNVLARLNRWIDVGFTNLSNVSVKDNATELIIYTENTDYVLDAKEGLIGILEGGAITEGLAVNIDYDQAEVDRFRIDGGAVANQKKEILFIGDPAEGVRQRLKAFVNIIPNGDFGFIQDEWQGFTYTVKFEDSDTINELFEYEELEVIAA